SEIKKGAHLTHDFVKSLVAKRLKESVNLRLKKENAQRLVTSMLARNQKARGLGCLRQWPAGSVGAASAARRVRFGLHSRHNKEGFGPQAVVACGQVAMNP